MSLESLIRQRIQSEGPLSIAEYMSLALTHPEYGYYMRKDPLGVQGDFITAPEISQIFGELIGAWGAAQWMAMGKPQAALVELGPGRGTLMADVLRATKSIAGFHEALSVHLVEASPVLRQKQWSSLAGKHQALHWHEQFTSIPPKPLLLIANEFFDALPIRQFIVTQDEAGSERMVGLDQDNKLVFTSSPPASTQTASTPLEIMEYSEATRLVMQSINDHIIRHKGAALIIDYGYIHGSRGDTLQAIKNHHYHDVLSEPGTADLTAHVDFALLQQIAQEQGLVAHGPVTQAAFLTRLGAGARLAKLCQNASDEQKSAMISALERLLSPDQMGDLFKVLCIAHPKHPIPEGFRP